MSVRRKLFPLSYKFVSLGLFWQEKKRNWNPIFFPFSGCFGVSGGRQQPKWSQCSFRGAGMQERWQPRPWRCPWPGWMGPWSGGGHWDGAGWALRSLPPNHSMKLTTNRRAALGLFFFCCFLQCYGKMRCNIFFTACDDFVCLYPCSPLKWLQNILS